jgi:hypothetical protein
MVIERDGSTCPLLLLEVVRQSSEAGSGITISDRGR